MLAFVDSYAHLHTHFVPATVFVYFVHFVKVSVCLVSFLATKLSMPLKVAYNEQEMKQMHRKYVTN